MVACFYKSRREVNVLNILIGSCIAHKDAGKVIMVKFAASGASLFDAHSRVKDFETREVRFHSVEPFKGSLE